MKQSKGFIELTIIGWLSLISFAMGVLSGGSVHPLGFSMSYNSADNSLYLTPIVHVETGWFGTTVSTGGLTLGGTILTGKLEYPQRVKAMYNLGFDDDAELRLKVLTYEQNHVRGWNAYGLEYGLKIFQEPCRYDPRAVWATCDNTMPTALPSSPTTGAIKISF